MRVTLKTLADETGYSITTVSRALAGYNDVSASTRDLIVATATRMDYQPNLLARQLQSQRTHTVGLILPAYGPAFADSFFGEFLTGVGTAAASASYDLLLAAQVAELEELTAYQRLVGSSRVDGVIVIRTRRKDARLIFLHEARIPFVAYGRSEADFDFSYVDVDGELGLRQLTQHFINLSHRRIGYISAPADLMFAEHRLRGYQKALTANGLSFDHTLIAEGDLTENGGLAGGAYLLQQTPRPTALIAANDLMAIGAMTAVRQAGLCVGQDVAVGGYDNTPLAAHTNPPLTSVSQPVHQIGQQICRLLIDQLHDPHPELAHHLLEPQLIIRASSGPAHST